MKHGKWFCVQSLISMWIIEMIATSTLAAGGGTRGVEVTRKRLRTRSPLLSWRRGQSQVIYWTKRRRNSSILERRVRPRHWRLSFRIKGRMVVVLPRHPLRMESPMVWTQKQLWWLLYRLIEMCRRTRESLFITWIFLFKQISVPTSNTLPLLTIIFIRLDVLENLWHSLQSCAFVMVYSVVLDMALFIHATTAAI